MQVGIAVDDKYIGHVEIHVHLFECGGAEAIGIAGTKIHLGEFVHEVDFGREVRCRCLGIVVIAHGGNDIEMFREVGLSVAMGNATDAVKAEADVVCGSVDEFGAVVEELLPPVYVP